MSLPPLSGRRLGAGLVLLAIAFNLRPALAGLGPLLPEIMRDTGLRATGAGLLTTLPVVCLGLFGLAAPSLAGRIGVERSVIVSLVAIAIGLLLRGTGITPILFAGSIAAGMGIGIGNVMMPAILKRDFGDTPALATGAYTGALCLGAALASASAVPLARALGGSWRMALAAWAAPALIATLVAYGAWRRRLTSPAPGHGAERRGRVTDLLGSALAWQVTLFMGLQSMLAYATFGWLAPILRARGDDAATAGLVVAVSLLFQMVGSLIGPALVARVHHQGALNAASVLLIAVSFVALVEGPLSWQWPLAVAMGLGAGGAFALAIMLMVLRSADGATAAVLSSMAQGIGYTLAALGPLMVGVLHDWTGDWRGAEAVFLAGGGIAAVAGALAGRRRVLSVHEHARHRGARPLREREEDA